MVSGLVILGVVLIVAGLVLGAAVVALMARSLLRPPRMTDGKAAWVLKRLSPGDLGLQFEDVAFDVRDERTGRRLRLAGWWIPVGGGEGKARRASERTVVLLHGYADAKVGAVAWAPLWHGLGFNILAIDLRAHGESGGDESTGGYFERHDVEQVIGQLRAERPREANRVVLFGVSLGAGVAAGAAALADEPLDRSAARSGESPDGAPFVSALVMESPFADFAAAAAAHMDALGLPGGPFPRAALWLAERLSGARFDEVRPVELVAEARCPVLIIAPAADPFRTDADTAAMEAALAARPPGAGVGRVWHVEGADHLMAARADPAEYRRVLESFLAQALGGSQPAAAGHTDAIAPPETAKLARNA